MKVQQVSEELGVRYVLEGSVRKEGDRVRITAQLIDAVKGYHVWSERYDRDMKDILALQEDIMANILLEMRIKLIEGEQVRYWTKKGYTVKYWETVQKLKWEGNKYTPEGTQMAKQLANDLIEMDPNYATGYYFVGWFHMEDLLLGRSKSPPKSMQLALEYARKASQLNEDLGPIRNIFGWSHLINRQYDLAIAEMEKWVALEPNGAGAHQHLGMVLHLSGRRDEAIRHLELALRLNPRPYSITYSWLGAAYAGVIAYGPKDPKKAIEMLKKAIEINPNDGFAHATLALIYSYQDHMEEARSHAAELLRINPKTSLKVLARNDLFKDKQSLKPTLELFRKAGIPEG